jgi:hypothetical protein
MTDNTHDSRIELVHRATTGTRSLVAFVGQRGRACTIAREILQ